MQEVKYVGSFEELLSAAEPTDPRKTALSVLRLPVTRGLHDRYAIIASGPEAMQMTQILTGIIDQLAAKLTLNTV